MSNMDGDATEAELLLLFVLAQTDGGASCAMIRELAGLTSHQLNYALEDLKKHQIVALVDREITLTARGGRLVEALAFRDYDVSGNLEDPSSEEQDPRRYLPSGFRRGGDDWLRSDEGSESLSGG